MQDTALGHRALLCVGYVPGQYSFRVGDHVECTMEKEVRRLQKIHLALAIAGGESIDAWAKK